VLISIKETKLLTEEFFVLSFKFNGAVDAEPPSGDKRSSKEGCDLHNTEIDD
jgi:hypothetical protein